MGNIAACLGIGDHAATAGATIEYLLPLEPETVGPELGQHHAIPALTVGVPFALIREGIVIVNVGAWIPCCRELHVHRILTVRDALLGQADIGHGHAAHLIEI